jgi:hypothetical protein
MMNERRKEGKKENTKKEMTNEGGSNGSQTKYSTLGNA